MHARKLKTSDAKLFEAINTAQNFLRSKMSFKTSYRASLIFEILNVGCISVSEIIAAVAKNAALYYSIIFAKLSLAS